MERLALPAIRRAWSRLQPVSLQVAARELELPYTMIKARRGYQPDGAFPDPIPVEANWRQAGILYDRRLVELWAAPESGFDLRSTPKIAKAAAALTEKIAKVVDEVKPTLLTTAAEALLPDVMHGIGADALTEATAAIERYQAEWDEAGSKPAETPDQLASAQRRLRSWRETWPVNGFPAPLPVDADPRTSEMFFSLPELRAWLTRLHSND